MDIEKIIKNEADESGNIPGAKVAAIVTAIKREVGQEFVERSRYNDRLTEVESLKAEIKKAEESATEAAQIKVKYDAIKAEYKEYKAESQRKAEHDAKAVKFRDALKAAGVPDKYHNSIVEVSNNVIDGIELDEKGNAKDSDKITEKIKEHWSDFIPVVSVVGAPSTNPVINEKKTYSTKDEIMSISDPEERQAQIAANIGLFTAKE